jgi:hypothetical protein
MHLVGGGYHMDQVSLTVVAVLFVKVEAFMEAQKPEMAPPCSSFVFE